MVKHLMDKPYIQEVLKELESLSYADAKGILLRTLEGTFEKKG